MPFLREHRERRLCIGRSFPRVCWGRKKEQRTGLSRLSEIAKSLVQLYREETALLRERDKLIAQLRKQGVPLVDAGDAYGIE